MKIPTDFDLTDVLTDQKASPPPRKPRLQKHDIFMDIKKFKAVDDHAIKVSQQRHRSFRGLIWHLVYSSKYVTKDVDKARVLFKWMVERDPNRKVFDTNSGENTVENIIEEFKHGRSTHAQIYQILCLYAGLHCKIISGKAKGKDYRPADSCSDEKYQHCWNAVCIEGNWLPVDTKWASKRKTHTGSEEFYFLTDPEKLLLSHWSSDPVWQLVERPISLAEFENLPFVKPHFFVCGLNFMANVKCVLQPKRGQLKWDLGVTKPTKFFYKMISVETGSQTADGQELKSFVYHEVHSGRAYFILRTPPQGDYWLKLFAKRLKTNRTEESSKFQEVVSYKVHIDRTCIEDDPLPSCWDRIWGPGVRSEKMCLYPVQKRGTITTTEKSICIEINKTRPVNVYCRCLRNDWNGKELQKCIKIQDNDTKAYVVLTMPMSGEYGLEIYGSFPNQPENVYTHVCQYLVVCTRRDDDRNEELLQQYLLSPEHRCADVVEKMTVKKETLVTSIPNGLGSPPASFQLSLVNMNNSDLPDPVPANHVTIHSNNNNNTWEQHIKRVCEENFSTFRELMWDLIYSKNIDDDITKARILFMWLASKKPQDLLFDDIEPGSPEEVLRGLCNGRTTYAMAFNTLCLHSGLPCRVITGVAKGSDYKPGQPLGPGSNHHTWNVVLIDGAWRLVDVRFARRPLQMESGEINYEIDSHFFLTHPDQFIYTHYPDDIRWQLLDHHVSEEEFCNMPVMTPHFFLLGMDILSHKCANIYSTDQVYIALKYPSNRTYNFTFSLQELNGSDDFQGIKYNRYGMLEAAEGMVTFRIRLPKTGTFDLKVYAKEDMSDKKENMFAEICEYIIIQEAISETTHKPYPPCAYQYWGVGSAFHKFGLITSQQSAVIDTVNGEAKITIISPKPMQFRTRLLHHENAAEYEGYVTQRTTDTQNVFNVTAPFKGEFGLEIYAKDPDTDTKKMRHVAQFLILCSEDVQTLQLPKLPSGFLGPQPMLVKYEITAASHPDQVIHTDHNNIEIIFKTLEGMRFTASLAEAETSRDCSENVFIQSDDTEVKLLVSLPRTGFFILCVHGNPFTDNSHQIPGLYNYLIYCKTVNQEVIEYPKQFGYWKEGCYMWKPMSIKPGLNGEFVPFAVRVPRATTVAVVVNKDWTPLVLSEESGIWEGSVQINCNEPSNKAVLVASYGGDQLRFATLLEYIL